MRAHVLLNLLNELKKRDKMRGLIAVMLMTSFLAAYKAYVQNTKSLHQQHVNCLINTWVYA